MTTNKKPGTHPGYRPARFLGRDKEAVRADLAAIRAELTQGFDEATALWHSLDTIARDTTASTFTRSRAKRAAVALGSLLDDLAADDDDALS